MLKWVNPSWTRWAVPWVRFKNSGPELLFTFDDGPHAVHTPTVLDALNTMGVHGLFFLRGSRLEGNEDVVRRIVREGHDVGNHGWTHRPLWFQPRSVIIEEIERTAEAVTAITGQRPQYFRPPYGRLDSRFDAIMKETRHQLMLWSLLSYDWAESTPESVLTTVRRFCHASAILVFHDGHRQGFMLPHILSESAHLLRQRGFTLA